MMVTMRKWIAVLLGTVVSFGLCLPAAAESAAGMRRVEGDPVYESFIYIDNGGDGIADVVSPAAYRPVYLADPASMGITLSEPADLFVHGDEIFIVDRSGGKIVVTDTDFRVKKELTGFDWQGKAETFLNPEGICVTDEKIYVADTGNRRIAVLDRGGVCLSVIAAPKSDLLSEDLVFEPLKIAVDPHGRIYTVVKGVYEGIMELYEDGGFAGFVGSIPVTPDPLMQFWKSVMSQEARNKLANFVPVEYTNLTVDSEGFIYATSLADENKNAIRRLNSAGSDILIRSALGDIPVNGVVTDSEDVAASDFVDIAADGERMYYALDRKYGRIFTYDMFGDLLFVFGGPYTGQIGTFQKASAIALCGDRVLVADMASGVITVFEQTEYAKAVLQGLSLYDDDRYEESIAAWEKVLVQDPDQRLAYDKIGMARYQLGQYREAMACFKTAGDQERYSKAFSQVRKVTFSDKFPWIVGGAAAVLLLLALLIRAARRWSKKHPVKKGGILDSLGYVFYVLRHPIDGFWDLKNEKRGRVWVSTLLIVLTVIAFAMERSMTGFALAADPFWRADWSHELKLVLLPVGLFLLANISVTSLMDGKGTFRQLYTATGYVLAPFILTKIPLTLISGILTKDEGIYVSLISALTMIYVGILMLAALSGTHEYTGAKTVGVALVTGVVMVIICFICVLFIFLLTEITGFLYTIVEELRYR